MKNNNKLNLSQNETLKLLNIIRDVCGENKRNEIAERLESI